MYLKRLEMIGFKSFPEKIKLEFNKGITAVVGPNGSGKSNISDAVRWVLGEQSAKSLRGAKMEDIIFAGTANRKPLSFAEVSLILDNTDKVMNIAFSEVTVTRRVYRSGESEYKLNGVSCRLKDIHELFMDTGIGREGYSIIGQGRIEEILASKGEERRHIFEEAAGIIKYKARRHDTINKLEKEKQNMIRLNDIIEEIEKQLDPLESQAEMAKEYLSLNENLKLIQVNIFLNQVDSISERTAKIDSDLNNVKSQTEDCQHKKNEVDNEILQIKADIEDKGREIIRLNQVINEIKDDIESAKNDIRLREEQKHHLFSDAGFYKKEIQNKKAYIRQAESILKFHSENIDILRNQLSKEEQKLQQMLQQFQQFHDITSHSESKIEKYSTEIFEQMKALTEIKNSYGHVENMYGKMELRKETLDNDLYISEGAVVLKNQLLSDSEHKLNEILENKDKINQDIKLLSEEKTLLKNDESITSNTLNDVLKNKNETSSRLKLLKELESSFEGYFKSVKNLLQYKKNNANKLNGIIGPVGELISVDKKYELAIEIALGQFIQNIVTESEADAQKGIELLKIKQWGRATFLPLTAIKSRTIGNGKENILAEKGVLGIADELISYSPAYANMISNILGRTIITDNIQNAVTVSKKYNYQYKIVTLEGDVINAGGAMTGGSAPQKGANIFGRTREINDLTVQYETLSSKEIQLRETLLSIQRQLNGIRMQEEKSKETFHMLEMEEISLKQKNEQLRNDFNSLQEKITDLKNENQMLMTQIAAANEELRSLKQQEVQTENLIQNLREDLNKFQASMSGYRTEKDKKASEITDIKVFISSIKEKLNAENANKRRLKQEIADANDVINNYEHEIEQKNSEIAIKETEINQLKNSILNLTEKNEILQKEAELLVLEQTAQNTALTEKENLSKTLFIEISNLTNERNRLEIIKENIDNEVRRLYDHMWDEYELTYQQAKVYPSIEGPLSKLQSDERIIRNSIKNLGNVNVNAIEEYKLMKERYDFLFSQREDIKDAEEKLKGIILQLTALMEEQFYNNFKIISDNFSKVFKEMFGGGKAYLKLSDRDNILESGIEIVAQPPGKALQNMTLLSGGERALTATAILFAILKMKPSPFCILDEIEAALDDANVARYANYLKNFVLDTQFILITHRKGAMEAADVLYGITMQEQGVSKLVSIKFDDESITA